MRVVVGAAHELAATGSACLCGHWRQPLQVVLAAHDGNETGGADHENTILITSKS